MTNMDFYENNKKANEIMNLCGLLKQFNMSMSIHVSPVSIFDC